MFVADQDRHAIPENYRYWGINFGYLQQIQNYFQKISEYQKKIVGLNVGVLVENVYYS
jgi:hypothetical protein